MRIVFVLFCVLVAEFRPDLKEDGHKGHKEKKTKSARRVSLFFHFFHFFLFRVFRVFRGLIAAMRVAAR